MTKDSERIPGHSHKVGDGHNHDLSHDHGHNHDLSHDHDHNHDHRHGHDHPGHSHFSHAHTSDTLGVSLGLTVVILAAEAVGGFLSHSLALLSDAAHMLTDVFALGLAWYAHHQSARPPTHDRTYGYHRAGIMAATVNALTLLAISAGIAWEAIERLRSPHPVSAPIMMSVAGVALVVNLTIARLLRHGDEENLNVRSALLHVLGDAAASAGVLVGGLIIFWRPDWSRVDSFLSLAISLVIVFGAWEILTESFNVLMEGTPRGIDPREVEEALQKIPGVQQVHHLHIWALTAGKNSMSGHVVIEDQALSAAESIRQSIQEQLQSRYNVDHATIQFEHQQCGVVCTLSNGIEE